MLLHSLLLVPPVAACGWQGGIKGGKTRANSLTPEQRKEVAQKADNTRLKK